jgi:O-acetyl-ADP-ribose deacetylase (regulator of RNase III)
MVSFPPGGACDCVVTAANEKLIGTELSYFPRGGPCPEPPPTGVSNSWGGMEAGSGMLYPTQCVDGRVHQEGGPALRAACAAVPEQAAGVRCPVGSAALTQATGRLTSVYRFVLHAVAPYRSDERWEPRLLASFVCTFELILFLVGARESGHLTVSVPLLGSGARGGGRDECAAVAVQAVNHFGSQLHEGGGLVLRFAVVDEDAQRAVKDAFGSAGWARVPAVTHGAY